MDVLIPTLADEWRFSDRVAVAPHGQSALGPNPGHQLTIKPIELQPNQQTQSKAI